MPETHHTTNPTVCKPEEAQVTPSLGSPTVKKGWTSPRIERYGDITLTKGVAFNAGDGISNLS